MSRLDSIKQHRSALLLLALFGWLYWGTLGSHGMFMWDEAEYATLGRNIQRGDPYSSSLRPPLLPLCVSAVLELSGRGDDKTAKIPVLFFALVTLGLAYGFCLKRYDRATAVGALAFLGLAPAFWQHASYLLTEIPLMMAFFAATSFFVLGQEGDSRWFFLSWISTALAFLTRYNGVLLGPIYLLLMAVHRQRDPERFRECWRDRRFWLAPFVGFALFAPWLVRQGLRYGDPLIGFKHAAIQLQIYIPSASFPATYYLTHLPAMLTWPLLVMVLAGLGWTLREREPYAVHCLLVALFLLGWLSAYRYKEVRLVTSILPYLAVLGAIGCTRQLSQFWSAFGKERIVLVLSGLLVFHSSQINQPFFARSVALGYPCLVEASKLMKEQIGADQVVMAAPAPQLTWYLDRTVEGTVAQEELEDKLEQVDWIVVVSYERGQPEYLMSLSRELFDADDLREKTAFYAQDAQGNATFWAPAPEFLKRYRQAQDQETRTRGGGNEGEGSD